MAKRNYSVSIEAWNSDQMNDLIASATGLVEPKTYGNNTVITVDHAQLTSAHDAAINTVFSTYVHDVAYGIPSEVLSLKGTADTLLQWSIDANNAFNVWDGQTTAQRFAVLKIVLQRFGILCKKMSDTIKYLKAN